MDERDRDEVADLAARILGQRGNTADALFAIEFTTLDGAGQDALLALMNERAAHGRERLEAIEENVRILRLLCDYQEGEISALQFAERVRGAVPDADE